MKKITICPAGEGRVPLSQNGTLLATGLVWVEYGTVNGEPFTGTVTQDTAKQSGIIFNKVYDEALARASLERIVSS